MQADAHRARGSWRGRVAWKWLPLVVSGGRRFRRLEMLPKTAPVGIPGLLLVLLILGCARGPQIRFAPGEVAAYSPLSPHQPLRILTINVWSGLTYDLGFSVKRYPDDHERRYAELLQRIRDLKPDIIAIQEANPLPRYAERLAGDLDFRVISHVALGGMRLWSLGIPTNLREGDAILVRKPFTLVSLERGRLQGGGLVTNGVCIQLGEQTQVLLARAIIHGRPLYVYAVHLHAGPYPGPVLDCVLEDLASRLSTDDLREALRGLEASQSRRHKELEALEEFIERTLPPGMPAILLGDFNTSPESGELAALLDKGEWIDSFALKNPGVEGATWDPEENPNYREPSAPSSAYCRLQREFDRRRHRFDAILVRGNLPPERILDSKVVLRPVQGVCPSDHYGVLTTLKW